MKYLAVIAMNIAISSFAFAQEGGRTMKTAQDVVEKLGLKPLPEEGGYYKETYKSKGSCAPNLLGLDGNIPRAISTAIYYLLAPNSFSALHRIKSDEIFHFYAGDPAEMIQIDPDGTLRRYVLGNDIFAGQTPQIVVPAGTWQALRLSPGGNWSLMGTTVAPGFEFEDFELGDQETMAQLFPQHRTDIMNFSRGHNESTH